MTGTWHEFDWRGRRARAWVPETLKHRQFEMSESTVRASEQATAALVESDVAVPTNWEPLARLLLRTEGVVSSSIEGVRAPIADVAVAELAGSATDAGWIVDNLDTVADAIAEPLALQTDLLHQWHRQLMGHSALPQEMIGAFRVAPSWIGGTSPLDAAFVPPPSAAVPELIDDLIAFANADHHDAVTQAAIVHAQFETIHPYGDGNGRLGRILIGWLLRRRGVISKLPPPLSVLIARDPGGYISGLLLYREGPVDPWLRWFAGIAQGAAVQSSVMVEAVMEILANWDDGLADLRPDSGARSLIPLLPQRPVVTSAAAAELLGISERAARSALGELHDRGILELIEAPTLPARGRPARYFAATELLNATASWAR